MGNTGLVLFDFAAEYPPLADRLVIGALMLKMTNAGFRFAASSYDFADRMPTDATLDALTQIWDNEREGTTEIAAIELWYEDDPELQLVIGINVAHFRQLFIGIDYGYISTPVAISYNRLNSFIRACELVYTVLHPEYGRGFISLSKQPVPDPSSTEVNITAVYDYNFLGPRLVQAFVREKLLSIPSWRTTQLPDGGVFFAMSPHPLIEWEPYRPNYMKAADTLGVGHYFQGG